MKVFLTGASGYVGRAVLDALLAAGHDVVALERPGSKRSLSAFAAEAGEDHLRIVPGDVLDPLSLIGGMDDCDSVIHLVGIIRERPSKGVTMERIHVHATKSLLTEASRVGVRRFLQMSALGAREDAPSAYHRTKWQAEQLVRRSSIPWTILQPSVVFGRGGPGPNFISQLVDLVQGAPILPIIGDGHYALQPVSINTVAQGITTALSLPQCIGRTYEVAGPDVVTYREILLRIADALHKPVRPVSIPEGVMTFLTRVLQRFPAFPITQDQLQMLKEGNVANDAEAFYRDLRLSPIPFAIEPPLDGEPLVPGTRL